jgi:hypothetical protein
MKYSIVSTNGDEFITVILPGADRPLATNSDHPNYEAIVAKVRADDAEGLADLFDAAKAAERKFESLSARVSVRAGRVYLDGDEIDNSLTQQIVRFLDQGVDDWQPLVAFFENVQANPDERSREQLFEFLAANGNQLTITPEGLIVGYKGVRSDGEGGYVSIHSGYAIVDGEEVDGFVPNNEDGVVEMPRSKVHNDPARACSFGLHVAAYNYASTWTSVDAVLEVYVHPRDVVSVPRDHGAQKVRVCRYVVGGPVDEPYEEAVLT